MNFFKRFTSVFFCCVLLSSFFVVSVSAVDDMNYYSLPSVGSGDTSVVMDWPVNSADFSNSDSQTLTNIYKYIQYLTLSPASWQSNSIIGFLDRILDAIPSNLGVNFALQGSYRGTNVMLDEIAKWTMFSYNYLSSDNIAGNLGNIQRNTLATADRITSSNTLLGSINDAVSGIKGYATESTLSSFSSDVNNIFYPLVQALTDSYTDYNRYRVWVPVTGKYGYVSFGAYLNEMNRIFTSRYTGLSNVTIFGLLQDLRNVLANEDDQAIREQQKANQDTVKDSFLSGSSSGSSLGKEDFGSLSGVGGTFKDITSLNGQASIGSFTDGLSSANETGQGWFSQATKDALDSVSDSSSNVSTFSVDGDYMEDVDIYNMDGFEDHYAWLWGD